MSLRGANDSERRSNLLVIGRLLREMRSQRHMQQEIASGEEQERPRNDMGSRRLLRNKRSQRHLKRKTASTKSKSVSQRHNNNYVVARMVHFPTKQSPSDEEIASGREQERPRNDMGSGRLLRNKRSQRHDG